MYKQSRIVDGIFRLLTVISFIVFGLGLIVIYSITAPQDAYSITDYRTGLITTYPAKPFQLDNFILYTFGLAFVLWVAFMVIVYIVNGFRTKE